MDDKDRLEGVKILVVEDTKDTLDMLKFLLSAYKAKVVGASSSPLAIAKFSKFRPDIILADIQMPEEDGFIMVKKIRALKEFKEKPVPILALTASARKEDRMRALQEGFDNYLAKPVDPDDLIALLTSYAKKAT